jgi:hypothetical protein
MTRTRTIGATSAAAILAAAIAIAGFLWLRPAPSTATPSARPVATAAVLRGTLLDTKTVTGTLGYGALSALRPSLAGTSAMVTWIAPVGSIIERGKPLYALDGQPAILFYGSVPQHRTLRFDTNTPSPIWVELARVQTALEAANLALDLARERLADAETRTIDFNARLDDAHSTAPITAQFIELAGAVAGAETKLGRVTELSAAQLAPPVEVAAAQAELAAARAAFDAAIRAIRKDLAAARLDAITARVAVAEAGIKRDELRTGLDALLARAGDDADIQQIADNLAALGYEGTLADQVRAWQKASGQPVTGIVAPSDMVVAAGPVHIADYGASVGETLIAASPDRDAILDYSSTEKLVTVPLGVGDRGFAAIGREVGVTLPDDSRVDGVISEIGSVVTEGNIEVTVTIADQTALGGLEVASVDVEFVSDSREDVLSVPITALLARQEGGFAVEVISGSKSTLVSVDTGLFAAGRVEITGDGIDEGVEVSVP